MVVIRRELGVLVTARGGQLVICSRGGADAWAGVIVTVASPWVSLMAVPLRDCRSDCQAHTYWVHGSRTADALWGALWSFSSKRGDWTLLGFFSSRGMIPSD